MTTEAADPHPLLHWWRNHVITSVDHRSVVEKVEDEEAFDGRYAFMILMSAGIAVLGLLLSSPAVIIGAMLISPLMGPIIGLGFGVALFDAVEIRRALVAMVLGTIMAILFCAAIVSMSPLQTVTSELAARTRPNLFDLLVALFSGLAGAYAMIRGREGAIVGVAIATALMPPLATVGFGLATANWTVFFGALLLFFTNFMVIALSAAIMARLYGFGPRLSPRQTLFQTAAMLAVFAALAVPLGLTLRQIAWETNASRQARDIVSQQFGDNARVSQLEIDYTAEPVRVDATVLTPSFVAQAERSVKAKLEAALGRPVGLTIEQFRVGVGDAEATQLARAQASERATREARAVTQIGEQLSLVAGVPTDRVLVDRDHRRAVVTATPLPGAGLEVYRALEARVAGAAEGWTVELVPPPAVPGGVSFGEDAPDAEGSRAIATAIWAARRLQLPIGVSGAQADVVVAALTEAGVAAEQVGSGNGAVEMRWLAPRVEPAG
ncbi:DUF389 domain-containing protein [Sphingomonas sp. S1-29]|uniref:DUF389 domain-containing protein n=1 Tax=Sphingomonas sp. S1-29 TaxID=2991074 RepID=UPI00223ED4F4|nr:DUF389 domain-containing protein [Sphingomonas sp. S1-29]UZK69965.1 DUF389 domain-containing protein [Sphingomonas sp. S1-29]